MIKKYGERTNTKENQSTDNYIDMNCFDRAIKLGVVGSFTAKEFFLFTVSFFF